MSTPENTFRFEMRPDNIGVIIVEDSSDVTVQHWYDFSLADMATYTHLVKRIYDMRMVETLSMSAIRTAIKVRKHPKANLVHSAILTNNSTVAALINVTLSVQAGGNFATFTDENRAVAWLHQNVPD